MPNLTPPVTSVADALAYRERIRAHVPTDRPFEPLMTLYLTDQTDAETIIAAADCPHIHGVKLYPAGATTNSASGVTALDPLYPVLAVMERYDLPLLVHGEVTDPDCDIFDREKVFIDKSLVPIRREFPELRIVFEHITTEDAVQFVCESGEKTAATITAHHLLYNRNDLLVGGIKPHFFAFRYSNEIAINWLYAPSLLQDITDFSWGQILPLMRKAIKNQVAVALGAIPRMLR